MAQAALTSRMWLKCLREAAQQLSADGIDFCSEQADVVGEGGSPFEAGVSPSGLSQSREADPAALHAQRVDACTAVPRSWRTSHLPLALCA
jgi:hypothetical protein